jgi:hypothetical protein
MTSSLRGSPALGHRSDGIILRNADIFDSITLLMKNSGDNNQRILNYRAIDYIQILYNDSLIVNIPINYLYLYNKVMLDINMERFTYCDKTYIPLVVNCTKLDKSFVF